MVSVNEAELQTAFKTIVLQKIKSQAALSLRFNAGNQGHCGLH